MSGYESKPADPAGRYAYTSEEDAVWRALFIPADALS